MHATVAITKLICLAFKLPPVPALEKREMYHSSASLMRSLEIHLLSFEPVYTKIHSGQFSLLDSQFLSLLVYTRKSWIEF